MVPDFPIPRYGREIIERGSGQYSLAPENIWIILICMMTQISKYKSSQLQSATESSPACCGQLDNLLVPGFFKALCDPNRVAILARLIQCCRPCRVGEISQHSPVSISVVSRHLTMLRDAGILTAEKQGREVWYSVRYPQLVRTLRELADAIAACCPSEVMSPPSSSPSTNTKTKTKTKT